MSENTMLENDVEIIKCIRRLIPVNELDDSLQNELIQQSDLLELEKNSFLFQKGDYDNYSYYLLAGEIDLMSDGQLHNTITGDTDRARHAMAQLQPRTLSARARTDIQILRLNRHTLDKLLVLSKQSESRIDLSDTISGPGKLEVMELDKESEDDLDWMTRLLQSELFAKMPTANIQKLFGLLQETPFRAGDVIVEQGQTNDNYYIVQEGSCVVTRKARSDSNAIKLAQLGVGESFGEESLLMDTSCNATVSMETDGVLMKLKKDHFIELIKKPTLQSVTLEKAKAEIEAGASWIDVRFESEFNESHIEGSKNVPLNLLRLESNKLDHDKKYIVYCDTGGRSSAAAFLLVERGLDVHFLEGGLISNSAAISSPEDVSETKDSSEAVIKINEQDDPDPVVRAVEIDTELECTNIKLKDIEKLRSAVNEVEAETKKRLIEDKEKLETEKSRVVQQAKQQLQKEQEKIRILEQKKENHLKQKKEELARVYESETQELAKIQRMKRRVQEELKKEKEELLKKQKAAEKMLAEASRIKQEVEQSRQELREKSIKQKQIQIEQETRRQLELKKKLAQQRQKISDDLAACDGELESARHEKDQAEANRNAAKQRSEQTIAEFQKNHDKPVSKQEEKLLDEQKRLKDKSQAIEQKLKQLELERKKTLKLQQLAQQEAALAAKKRLQAGPADNKVKLKEEAILSQKKMEAASRQLLKNEQAQRKVSGKKASHQQQQPIQQEDAASLEEMFERDLIEFNQQQEENEPDKPSSEPAEIMDESTEKLLNDISSQLDGTHG